jgi:hypothetical protein
VKHRRCVRTWGTDVQATEWRTGRLAGRHSRHPTVTASGYDWTPAAASMMRLVLHARRGLTTSLSETESLLVRLVPQMFLIHWKEKLYDWF